MLRYLLINTIVDTDFIESFLLLNLVFSSCSPGQDTGLSGPYLKNNSLAI